MVRRIRHGASVGLIVWMVAVSGGPAAAQVPPGPGTAIPVAVGAEAAPGELQAWDARLDGMIRTGQLVVMSRTDDPTLADRTHEYAAQFVGGVPVLGAGVTRQFASGVTVSAFGTLRENLVLDTAPAITAGEAAVHLERQTGARLADGQAPELTVLPLPSGSYVLAYGAALDDGRYHFASAADGRLVHSFDAFRSQSAIGTGVGILGDRKKVSTIFEGGRFETHDQLRPGEIVTLDIGFDVHRAPRARSLDTVGERRARKLRPLVGVEDAGRPRLQRRLQRLDAEAAVHRVRQPPRQHLSAGPVHDRDQVQKAGRHRDVRDVRAPHLVQTVDLQFAQQVRVDVVIRLRVARARLAVDRLQAHQAHQALDSTAPRRHALAPQVARHLPTAVERVLERQGVHPPQQRQVLRALSPRRVVHR